MTSTYGSNALKGSGPSISMVDNMGSIGNYKGVMLCNRPFGGTVGQSALCAAGTYCGQVCLFVTEIFSHHYIANKAPGGGGSEKTTFNCGVVSEPAGLNVPIAAKQKVREYQTSIYHTKCSD